MNLLWVLLKFISEAFSKQLLSSAQNLLYEKQLKKCNLSWNCPEHCSNLSARLAESSCFKAKSSSSRSFLYKAFHKQTTREIKCIRGLPKVMLILSVRPSQGSCFKLLHESRKRSALFIEEQNEKLQRELRENQAKSVSVDTQSQVFCKES